MREELSEAQASGKQRLTNYRQLTDADEMRLIEANRQKLKEAEEAQRKAQEDAAALRKTIAEQQEILAAFMGDGTPVP